MDDWPLTSDEKLERRKRLAQQVNMIGLVSKFSKHVEEWSSGSFTHKATCPNPSHKGGNERTPSFYFSEHARDFKCFGCQIYGDAFDLLSLMKGGSADALAEQYAEKHSINFDGMEFAPSKPTFRIIELNFDLSLTLREYLRSIKNEVEFLTEVEWVERMFKRIDERFSKLTDEAYAEAHNFYIQILMELERRKL